jgi:hypothetical protein
MPSPIAGVWELVSNTEKALWIFGETHHGAVFEREQGRRGLTATYTVEDNRTHSSILVDTAPNFRTTGAFEFQCGAHALTTTLIDPGTVSPAGHVDHWRKVSDFTRTSPHAGVWQLLSDTDQGLNVRTDTHWVTVVHRGDFRRGFAGTYTVEGNCLHHAILFDTDPNAPSHIDLEFELEGDINHVKIIAGSTRRAGALDQWRKIA